MSTRVSLSMDKDWSFHPGDVKEPLQMTHSYIYNTSKAGACPGVPQEDFDAREWETVNLPHDWAVRQPFSEASAANWGYKSGGKAWYRKVFAIPEKYRDKELTIEFEGVATHAVVYFNGSVIHRNFSAYTPFQIGHILAPDPMCWQCLWMQMSGRDGGMKEQAYTAMSGSTSRIPSIFRSMDFPYGWRRLRRIHGK